MSTFIRFAVLISGISFSIASCSTLNLPKAHLGGGAPVPRSNGNTASSRAGSRETETHKPTPKPSAASARSSSGSKPAATTAERRSATTEARTPAREKTNSTARGGEAPNTARRASLEERRLDIVDYAEQFRGIKYLLAGKTPYTGFDCSGFTSYVMKGFGVALSPSSDEQSKDGVEVDLEDVKPGDLLFFGLDDDVQHVAIVVKNDDEGIFCVHSTSSRGVIVENVSASSYWEPRIMFARDVLTKK